MMNARSILANAVFFVAALCPAALAQTTTRTSGQRAAPAITVSLTDRGVRFAALGAVTQTRLEVFGPTGEQVYTSGFLSGNVRDWSARAAQGEPLPDGAYTCVITATEAGGQVSTKEGSVLISGGQLALQLGGGGVVTEAAQGGAARPGQPTADAGAGEPGAMTLTAHDGTEGQVTSTAGALSFRLGDFFSGKDKEAMRLTEKGLTVEGDLRASGLLRATEGIELPDGTVLKGALEARESLGAGGAAADTVVDGDLVFTSPGTPNYGRDIRLSDNLGGVRIFGAPSLTSTPAGAALQFFGNAHTLFPGQAFVDAGAHNSAAVIFRSAPAGGTIAERMRITAAGNVGVGTSNPALLSGGTGRMIEISNPQSPGLALTNTGTGGNQFFLYSAALGTAGSGSLRIFDATNNADRFVLANNGNVGVGTTNPASKLHVAGELTLDATAPILHMGTADAEQNRYLHLINSPAHRSASGLKAGGVLVSDSFDFANPGKNSLIVKGTAAVGASSAPSGVGLYGAGPVVGVQGAGSSQGVRGEGGTYGVFGRSTSTTIGSSGVYGSGGWTGIHGVSAPGGWAGVFDGPVRIGDLLGSRDALFYGSVSAIEFIAYSDRNAKNNFAVVNPRSVLQRLAAIPIQTWNYKTQPEQVRHMGPMAQDFRAAFQLGHDDKHISTIDAQGVSFAAIQGLYQLVQEKEKQIEQLQARVVRLERARKKGRAVRAHPRR